MARLLIVDPEESLRRLLEIAIGKMGHLVETASNGQAAKSKIETAVYDVIISEIRMAEVTGLDLLEYARTTKSRARFILMTAVPTMTTAIEAVNLGAYRYVIKKDTLVEDLCAMVEGALKEQSPGKENSGCS